MALFDNVKSSFLELRKKSVQKKYDLILHNDRPVFSSFGQNIYASDVVQNAIKCITDELIKCQPMHIIQNNKEIIPQDSDITRVLQNPNDLMTTSDFICKITYLYMTRFNVFIYPQYEYYYDKTTQREKRKLIALYPLNPVATQFFESDDGGLYVEFTFADGKKTELLPYDYLIHWRKDFTANDYMGGNINGQANIDGLLKVLKINNTLLDSLPNAIKSSYTVNGILKYGSVMSMDKQKENLEKFNQLIAESKSGITSIDMGGEYIPLSRDIKFIDSETLKFVNEKILQNYRVPLCILTGDYSPQQHEAYIQSAIEPLIISLGQAFTKGLFSQRASFGFGNKVVFYFDRIESMTIEQKRVVIQELGGRGALTNNYMLSMFGIPPYPEGDKRYMSLNYVDVEIANQYQMSRAKAENKGGQDDKNE